MRGHSAPNALANGTDSGDAADNFTSPVTDMANVFLRGRSEIVVYSREQEGESHFRVNAYVFFGLLSTAGAVVGNILVLSLLCFFVCLRRLCKCSSPPPVDTTVVHASDVSVDSEARKEDSDEDEMREEQGKRVQTFVP